MSIKKIFYTDINTNLHTNLIATINYNNEIFDKKKFEKILKKVDEILEVADLYIAISIFNIDYISGIYYNNLINIKSVDICIGYDEFSHIYTFPVIKKTFLINTGINKGNYTYHSIDNFNIMLHKSQAILHVVHEGYKNEKIDAIKNMYIIGYIKKSE